MIMFSYPDTIYTLKTKVKYLLLPLHKHCGQHLFNLHKHNDIEHISALWRDRDLDHDKYSKSPSNNYISRNIYKVISETTT